MQGDITALNEAVVAEDADKINDALEALKNSSLEIGKAIYAQSDDGGDSGEQQQEQEPEAEEAEQKDDE